MKLYFTAPDTETAMQHLDVINRATGFDLTIHEALIDVRDVEWIEGKFKYIAYDESLSRFNRKTRDRFYEMCEVLDRLEKIGHCKKVYLRSI